MTTLMDRLEADGLVRRVADPADRRSVRAELTKGGREASRAGMAVVAGVQRDFSESLVAQERELLRRTLTSLG
jgi:DNA-binding MarR family transcriptional regulator